MTKKFSELREFTDAQMAKLKKEYEPLKGKTISMANINKMNSMLNTYSIDMLMKLAKGDVPFLSTSAKSKLVIKHGKKWTDFKEPLDMAEADELQQEACWVGYKQVGMKKKGDRQVPNCVKEELVESKMQVQNLKTLSHRTAFRATIKKVLPSVVAYGSDSNPDFLTFVGSKSDLESLATMAKQYKVGPIRESMDDDCPTCNGGECQCANEMTVKVCEDCGNDECVCVSLEEALKVKYDKTKQGWFDDKGRRRYLGNAATNAIMKKKLDHAIKTGDWTSFDVSVNEMMEAHQGQGLPPHLAKLFDKDGKFKDPKTQKKYQDMIDRQGKTRLSKVTDVTPKGYGPKEENMQIEGKYLKYSNLLMKKAKEMQAIDKAQNKSKVANPSLNAIKEIDKEIEKEKKKLGIKEEIEEGKKILISKIKDSKIEKDIMMIVKKNNLGISLSKSSKGIQADGNTKDLSKLVDGLFDKHMDNIINPSNPPFEIRMEGLDKEDEKSVDDVVKQLKKAVKAHQGQVKSLTKDLKDEADLTKTQIKMVHKKADDLPKNDFVKRYGKDGDSVRFATATNMVKKKLGVAENLIKGENEMNESYKDNFNAAMEELGINSLDELKSVEEQKAFFSYVDSLEEGLTAGQKKLPPALQKSILAKQGDKKEELSDKQKEMDVNKNGKIDGEDLAKLRTKKEQADSPAQQAAIAISKKEKEMSKEMKELKAETDPEKMETMKKEMMEMMKKEMANMDEMSETMKKEVMKEMKKKMDEYGSMNINAMKEMAEMKPMNKKMVNAMTDPSKMNAMHSQDPKQDMIKKHSADDIRAMKTMEMDMAKNNDDTVTPSMETMKAMMMKKDEMEKKETASKRMNAMKDANPMYAMKDAAQKEMMNAMKKVQMNDKKKIQATYEKYLVTKEGSLEAAVLTSVSTKKTD